MNFLSEEIAPRRRASHFPIERQIRELQFRPRQVACCPQKECGEIVNKSEETLPLFVGRLVVVFGPVALSLLGIVFNEPRKESREARAWTVVDECGPESLRRLVYAGA